MIIFLNDFNPLLDIYNVKAYKMKSYITTLLRESLLTEITSEEAWDKHYSDVEKFPSLKGDKELFLKLDSLYPKKGNQHNRGYFMWLYKMYRNGLKEEDFYKVEEYLQLFNKYINKIDKDKRDINKYSTIQDLLNVVKSFRGAEVSGEEMATSKTDEIKKRREKELKLVYKDDTWKVYIPMTEWASCEIGKGTEWCTAATKSNNMFDHYNSDGPLYVLINNDDKSRYQLHFPSNQLMDVNDRTVPASYFFDHIAEDNGLYEFLKGESDKFYEFVLATSDEDMADGGYSETFEEALNSADKTSTEYREALRTLRYGRDSYSRYLGFVYEDDVDNISEDDVKALFDEYSSMDSDDINQILKHLVDIGFDFEEAGLSDYTKIIDDLKVAKLDIGNSYKIDKGRTIRINGLNFDDDSKPYNVTVYEKDGKSKSGDVSLDSLKSMVYNLALFERVVKRR